MDSKLLFIQKKTQLFKPDLQIMRIIDPVLFREVIHVVHRYFTMSNGNQNGIIWRALRKRTVHKVISSCQLACNYMFQLGYS